MFHFLNLMSTAGGAVIVRWCYLLGGVSLFLFCILVPGTKVLDKMLVLYPVYGIEKKNPIFYYPLGSKLNTQIYNFSTVLMKNR